MWRLLMTLMLLAFGAACAPELGDSCSSSVDCSVNGDRICDTASPGGYCATSSCDRGTCPEDEGVCVEFTSEPARTATSFCMAACEDASDCRQDEGYRCIRAAELVTDQGAPLAQSLDGENTKFCAFTMR